MCTCKTSKYKINIINQKVFSKLLKYNSVEDAIITVACKKYPYVKVFYVNKYIIIISREV